MTRVLAPGHVQLFANRAYLNSSSHTTCSANLTCNLCSGLQSCIITYSIVCLANYRHYNDATLPLPEYLHVLWHTGRKVLHRPRPKYRMLVGCRFVRIVPRGQYEACLRLVHSGSRQITVFQARTLDVDDALRPDRHLQDHSHRGVQLHGTEQHHVEILQQRMGVELVEKVHDRVGMQCGRADDYMLFALGTM